MSSLSLAVETQAKIELAAGRVVVDGHEILLTELQWGMICALARCRHAVPREQLEAMLWPDACPEQAQNLLSVGLHRLRRRLGDRFVVASPEGYRLGEHVEIDLWEIEARSKGLHQMRTDRAAVQQWMLTFRSIACTCTRSSGKYDFVRALERRLSAAAIVVNEFLASETLRHGDADLAYELAQLALKLDPCDEAASEIAIRAHLALGNRAAAIREYTQYARTLAEELDLEPCFTLRSLIETTAVRRPTLVRS